MLAIDPEIIIVQAAPIDYDPMDEIDKAKVKCKAHPQMVPDCETMMRIEA